MTTPLPAAVPMNVAVRNEVGTVLLPEQINMQGTTDPYETTPELRWPLNYVIYEKMRRSDGQIRGLLRGINMPVLGVDWHVEQGSRIRPEVAATVEAQMGLTRDEKGRRRSLPGGVNWDDTQRHALLSLVFGSSYFECWWQPARSDVPGLQGRPANLFRMAPRLPRSIVKWHLAANGDLAGIIQWVATGTGGVNEKEIVRANLVPFVNYREGADWAGKSILRAVYKDWLLKDTLLRTGAVAADRQGIGIPVVTYPANDGGVNAAMEKRALEIATSMRAGEDAGVAIPEGWTVALVGVEGNTVDVMPQVKYHDQSIAASGLAMFMTLGHDAGARALGDTFFDVFLASEEVLIGQFEEVYTEECSRRIVAENFGPDEPYPAIVAGQPNAQLTALALSQLAQAGLLGDLADGITDWVRSRFGMPKASNPTIIPVSDGLPAPTDPARLPTAPTAPGQPTSVPGSLPLPATRVAAAAGRHNPLDVGPDLATRLERAVAILRDVVPAAVG